MVFSFLDQMTDAGRRLLDQADDVREALQENNVRLGVTGLRRSGKTVFVTSLVENLLRGGRLPFLDLMASRRFQAARLRPQPDPDVPRFAVEIHRESLTGAESCWPDATRGISQLRVALRFTPMPSVWAWRGARTVNLDIIDYPGEWLLDLPLLQQDFTTWSRFARDLATRPPRDGLSAGWRSFTTALDPAAEADEAAVRQGAALYTDYLHACRAAPHHLSLVQPGRFVEPGDLAGAPLLTFFPLEPPARTPGRHALWSLLEARYEAYRDTVVRRFFRDHFARLDRQIVLIDLLGALASGPDGVTDMQTALMACLEAFRHGNGSWLEWLTGRRIDRVLFAATKADHLAASQHLALRNLLDAFIGEARASVRFEGATVESMALAAVKCTETVNVAREGRTLACVQGLAEGRERPTILYPGDLPASLAALTAHPEQRPNFLAFRPPPGLGNDGKGFANIRLDQALQFLLGDYFT